MISYGPKMQNTLKSEPLKVAHKKNGPAIPEGREGFVSKQLTPPFYEDATDKTIKPGLLRRRLDELRQATNKILKPEK